MCKHFQMTQSSPVDEGRDALSMSTNGSTDPKGTFAKLPLE